MVTDGVFFKKSYLTNHEVE